MGVKISELTSASSLTGSEELPIVQAGNTKKATISQVKAQNYSTTEQVIGTWIDGKPLYEKCVNATAPTVTTAGTNVYTQTAHNISNVDFIFVEQAINISSTEHFTLLYTTASGYSIKATATSTYININSNATNFNGHTILCVLRYTKTTDTATQTRSANLTMNTGSLVGSGEKSNLLGNFEDVISDDTKEEKEAEEVTEEIENKEVEGSGDER